MQAGSGEMGYRFDRQCIRCKRWEVEQIDDWISDQCPSCNDRDIEHANERREWHYYHTDER